MFSQRVNVIFPARDNVTAPVSPLGENIQLQKTHRICFWSTYHCTSSPDVIDFQEYDALIRGYLADIKVWFRGSRRPPLRHDTTDEQLLRSGAVGNMASNTQTFAPATDFVRGRSRREKNHKNIQHTGKPPLILLFYMLFYIFILLLYLTYFLQTFSFLRSSRVRTPPTRCAH